MKKLLFLLPFLFFAVKLSAQTPTAVKITDEAYTIVEAPPEFPDGEEGLARFLSKNIKYPKSAKKNNIQGKVYIQFVVEKDGSLSNFKVVQSPDETLSDETLRVLQKSPKWTPGTQKGQPVRVQFTLPINFSLTDK